jgi:predicted Zn-dependent peptidase
MNMLARRTFAAHFFKNDERYARTASLADYDKVDLNEIISFHQSHYLKGLVRIICVANLDTALIDKWCEKFSLWTNQQTTDFISAIDNSPVNHYEEKDDAVQTAIRIGFPLFNKCEKDYAGMYVLQTILGDYFGSRLMSNLREDKGYTYGIGSGILEMKHIGYLVIASEVKKEFHEDALTQIKFEVERLKTEEVGEEELTLVKNYLLGQFLKSADGSDALMELFLTVHPFGLSLSYYTDFVDEIKNCTATELRNLAIKYLDINKATIIQVG